MLYQSRNPSRWVSILLNKLNFLLINLANECESTSLMTNSIMDDKAEVKVIVLLLCPLHNTNIILILFCAHKD